MLEEAMISGLKLVMLLSALPLGCAVIVGSLIGFVQSALQIQEQSVAFTAKLFVTFGMFYLFGGAAERMLVELLQDFLNSSAQLGFYYGG